MFAEVYGSRVDQALARLDQLDPVLVDWADSFVFGGVWQRQDQLGSYERYFVAISALSVLGRYRQLKAYIHGAIESGIEVEKLKEALLMLCVYGGFPVGTNALEVLQEVLSERES